MENFIEIVASDKRIKIAYESSIDDGMFGFDGSCFPKDTSALLYLSKSLNESFLCLKKLLKSIIKFK